MASKQSKTSSASGHRVLRNVLFVIAVLVLLAALGFIYRIHINRNTQFQKMKNEVSASEAVIELEPRIVEDEREENDIKAAVEMEADDEIIPKNEVTTESETAAKEKANTRK